MNASIHPYSKIAQEGLWRQNAGLVQLLGLCPLLAISTSMVNGVSLGLATALVMALASGGVALVRNLIPNELAKGFGFYQSKPASAFSPVAVTPDELGADWRESKLCLPLLVTINDEPFGKPNAGEDMTFSFAQLIAHASKTRELGAGSIIGSGTVSNKQGGLHGSSIVNGGVGYCCLAEVRMYETIEHGAPKTPFLRFGDSVRIEMLDAAGESIFGAIDHEVAHYHGAHHHGRKE